MPPSPPPSPPSSSMRRAPRTSAATAPSIPQPDSDFVRALEMELEEAKLCLDADAVILHVDKQLALRIGASGVWERSFGSERGKRRLKESAAQRETQMCGEVIDMQKRLREMERRLATTVAEQARREEVAAGLKKLRDQDLRKCAAKMYRKNKELVQTQEELNKTKKQLKASNWALFESEKLARGLAQKLILRDRTAKG
eukprot:5939895-Pleurochrysis_carterae.AAC.3